MLRAAERLFLALFATLIAATLFELIRRAFGIGRLDAGFSSFAALLAEPGVWRALMLSLWTGLASTILTVALTMLAFAGLFLSGRGRLLERVSRPILAMPHAAFAFGLFLFLTPGGWSFRLLHALTGWFPEPPAIITVNDEAGIALILALMLKEIPFLVLVAMPSLSRLMAEGHWRAALALGHAPAQAFLGVIWPRLYADIRLPVFAVLVYGASVVDMAQILGPTTPPTFAVLVTRLISAGGADGFAKGEAGGVALILLCLAAAGFWLVLERCGAVGLSAMRRAGWRGVRLERPARLAAIATAGALALSAAFSIATLILCSFTVAWPWPALWPARLDAQGWMTAGLFGPVMGDTLLLAFVSTLLGAFLVLLILEAGGQNEERSWRKALLFAPLLLPQLSLVAGLGMVLEPLGISYSIAAVCLAHLLYVIPYVYLSFRGPWQSLDPRYTQVAEALGRAPLSTFLRVRLPLLTPHLAVALGIGASVSFALYLPTLIAGGGRIATVTTEAVALASGGEKRRIAVYSLTQALLPAIGFLLAAVAPTLIRRAAGWVRP